MFIRFSKTTQNVPFSKIAITSVLDVRLPIWFRDLITEYLLHIFIVHTQILVQNCERDKFSTKTTFFEVLEAWKIEYPKREIWQNARKWPKQCEKQTESSKFTHGLRYGAKRKSKVWPLLNQKPMKNKLPVCGLIIIN